MHIGFAGLGRMGSAMARRLIDAGHEVTVWNRSAAKTTPLAKQGAKVAAAPGDLARAEIIISMLSDDESVAQFYDQLLGGDIAGKLLIDTTTVRPDTAIEIAKRAAAKGAHFIDAPVSGTVGPARDGKLLFLAGGAADDIARAQTIFDQLGRRVVHAGPNGSGALLKLVVNTPLAVYWVALAEAIAMGRAGGLDLKLMLETIKDSPVALGALGFKINTMLGAAEDVAFDVASMQKDVLAILSTGSKYGVPMPAAGAALATYAATTAAGLQGEDAVAVVRFLSERMVRRKTS